MELAINNLVKITIGVVVLSIVILGFYLGVKNVVIPYFSGIGFTEPQIDTTTGFGKELMKKENFVGVFNRDNYFIYDGTRTSIYFKGGNFYSQEYLGDIEEDDFAVTKWLKDNLNPDEKIGGLDDDGKIKINRVVPYAEKLDGAYKLGREVRKIQ